MNGDVIPESEKVKYLGHIICSDSDDEDIMRQRRHLYAQGNVISRSLHMCSIAVKNTLFCTFCTSFPCISVTCGGTIRHRAFIS